MNQQHYGKLKLMSLTIRRSAKGTEYLQGILNGLSVVAFRGEPTQWGETWDVFIQEQRQKNQPASGYPQRGRQDSGFQRQDQRREPDAGHAVADMFHRPLNRDRGGQDYDD